MDSVCRLCLRCEQNMTSIFSKDSTTSVFQLQIKNCCSIEVLETDSLPKMICKSCKDKLSFAEEFRKECKYSDKKLREYYKISTPDQAHSPLRKEFQDNGIQTEEKRNEDSKFRKQTYLDTVKQEYCENKTSVSLDKDYKDEEVDQAQESASVRNLITSENSDCQTEFVCVKNDDETLVKRTRVRSDPLLETRQRFKFDETKEKLMCHLCQKVYVSKKALLRHTEAHMREKIITCKICNKVFNSNDKLTNHMRKHSDNMDFKCEVCGMPFKELAKLNCHLRVHGKGPPINMDKQYLCDVCSRTYATKSGLRFHLRSHGGTKPYTCKFCNKSFTIPSYKTRHERTHTGDKHFTCHICSVGFASANGLKYHVRSHTGEANYHCTTCGKSFRRLKYLKEHTFVHTGEKPFVCKLCGSAYGNSGSLFVHQKKCKAQYTLE
ncbi:zinc finger protein 878-like [Athalia rosae]|uniref:zinc finger protein 878-like n=1 Tax=Athalia rosae TaxID=37344 RepID=UPI0020340D83|nr:zinc finger protein 878-like [Athalia rosae]